MATRRKMPRRMPAAMMRLWPAGREPLETRIFALLDEERLDEAYAAAMDAASKSPGDPDPLFLAALAASTREEKADLIRRAVALVPDDPVYLTRAAMSIFHTGEIDTAAEYAARASAHAPPNFAFAPELCNAAGRIAGFQGDYERAERLFRAAFEAQPETPFAGVHLADVLAILGRDEEALEVIQRSLKIFPEEPWLHDLRAQIVERLGPQRPPPRAVALPAREQLRNLHASQPPQPTALRPLPPEKNRSYSWPDRLVDAAGYLFIGVTFVAAAVGAVAPFWTAVWLARDASGSAGSATLRAITTCTSAASLVAGACALRVARHWSERASADMRRRKKISHESVPIVERRLYVRALAFGLFAVAVGAGGLAATLG